MISQVISQARRELPDQFAAAPLNVLAQVARECRARAAYARSKADGFDLLAVQLDAVVAFETPSPSEPDGNQA